MKSLYYEKYGDSDVLSIRDIPKPKPQKGEVLVKVQAASVNPLDWRLMQADPFLVRLAFGLRKPKSHCLGADFSGVVESVADDVTQFKNGDSVWGIMAPNVTGTFAEYITIAEEVLVRKPESLSHQQASTLGVAALTAYEGIHDYWALSSGDRVLINGASGGIGTFAIQMAKAQNAHVTAVCSGYNHALVRRLGADAVIDYRSVNLTKIEQRFDLIFDTIGNHSPGALKPLLRTSGKLVLASAGSGWGFLRAMMIARKDSSIELIVELKKGKERLESILKLFVTGKLKPVIDREYPFAAIPDAIDYVATKRAKGKVVIKF